MLGIVVVLAVISVSILLLITCITIHEHIKHYKKPDNSIAYIVCLCIAIKRMPYTSLLHRTMLYAKNTRIMAFHT